jgi:hypothetical protein
MFLQNAEMQLLMPESNVTVGDWVENHALALVIRVEI